MAAAPHELVAAEVRAELARQQLSGVKAAQKLGWTQNYISVRLRGVVPFDVTDLISIAALLEVPVASFFSTAMTVATPGLALVSSGQGGRKQDNRPPIRRLASAA